MARLLDTLENKMRNSLAVFGILCLALLNVTLGFADEKAADSGYIPKAAEETILKSQGQVVSYIFLAGSHPRVKFGSGFLFDKALVITALHNLPKEIDIWNIKGRIFFNRVPVKKVKYFNPRLDVAILELEQTPEGSEPAVFTEDIPVGTKVFAKVSGIFEKDVGPEAIEL